MTKEYYCPNCGAKLVPERLGNQSCPYCEIMYSLPDDESEYKSITWNKEK